MKDPVAHPSSRVSITALVLAAIGLLSACGGGGGTTSPAPAAPAPDETLFVPANAWQGATPANAEFVAPDEFRRRQAAGELVVVTPSTPQAQRAARLAHIEAERDFLESQSDISSDVRELLARAQAASDVDGDTATSLTNGKRVALNGLGTRIEEAARQYRLARDPANALGVYGLSYNAASDEVKAEVPAPATLQGATLEAIRLATRQLDEALASTPDLDKTRLDPDAPVVPTATAGLQADRKHALAITLPPGNGSDNSGACRPTGYAMRYWFPLRNFVSPVKDQAKRGTCWAFSAIGAVESRERVQNNNVVNLSEQFLINKYKADWFPSDFADGGSPSAALNTAVDRNQALPDETLWTYNPAAGRPADAFQPGVVGTIASYTGACNGYTGGCSNSAHEGPGLCTKTGDDTTYCGVLETEFNGPGVAASRVRLVWSKDQTFNPYQVRALLASGVSLLASFPVYEGLKGAPGIVSNYDKKRFDKDGMLVDGDYGAHVAQIVGFVTNEQLNVPGAPPPAVGGGGYFILRNSWGCDAGDGGYFYVPGDYVTSLFTSLEALDFDGRRSTRWNDDQVTPGGTAGLAIDALGTAGFDLRVQGNLAGKFTVSHPTANYVRLTVRSDIDGNLFDGQWLVNAPAGGALFANSLPVNFQTEGARTLTITARYGTQTVATIKRVVAFDSAPKIVFEGTAKPAQGENFVVDATVTDINEVNPAGICATMVWAVTAPDVIVSGSGCSRVVRFGATGNRTVSVSANDAEGSSASASGSFDVSPPPVNPYPRIASFGVVARDYLRISNQIAGCYNNSVANNALIDLRELGCNRSILGPDVSRYLAQLGIENPAGETLRYDWTYSDVYPNPAALPPGAPTARILKVSTTTPSVDLDRFLFGSAGTSTLTTNTCTIDVLVNAPDPSRSKALRVWSGRCINIGDSVR